MEKFKTFISKKLFVTVGMVVLVMVNKRMGNPFDDATIKDIVLVVAAYLFGQAAVDVTTAIKAGGK